MAPFTDQDIDDVVALAFEHTAGVITHQASHAPADAEWVSASLTISGAWSCSLLLSIEHALAVSLTQAMWDHDHVSDDDVNDAVGELANVVAGGVKGMTPHPGCELSTPVVTRGALPPRTAAMHRSYLVGSRAVALSVTL